MGSQWTWAAETEMVMLSAAELEGGCTPSDTPDHQHGSLPLPSGGGTLSDTVRKKNGGPPESDVAVLGGTREEGGLPPWRRG